MYHTLKIEDYRTFVRLGWHSHEWDHPQEIRVDVEIRFAEKPKAAVTDHLKDTICYEDICAWILDLCQKKSFRLIEHLAEEVSEMIRKKIFATFPLITVPLAVTVQKVSPQIGGLRGGVFYRIGDFP